MSKQIPTWLYSCKVDTCMVYMPLGYPTVKLVLTAIWPLQKPENALHLTGHKDPGTKQILHEKCCTAGMDFMG